MAQARETTCSGRRTPLCAARSTLRLLSGRLGRSRYQRAVYSVLISRTSTGQCQLYRRTSGADDFLLHPEVKMDRAKSQSRLIQQQREATSLPLRYFRTETWLVTPQFSRPFPKLTARSSVPQAPTSVASQILLVQLPSDTICSGGPSGNLCLASFKTAGGFGNCVVLEQSTTSRCQAAAMKSKRSVPIAMVRRDILDVRTTVSPSCVYRILVFMSHSWRSSRTVGNQSRTCFETGMEGLGMMALAEPDLTWVSDSPQAAGECIMNQRYCIHIHHKVEDQLTYESNAGRIPTSEAN